MNKTLTSRPGFAKAGAVALIAFATTLALSACGDSDDSVGPKPAPVSKPQPLKQNQTKKTGASNPASAGDKRPAAPDDKISERPGGPKNGGKRKPKKKSGKASPSGGISVSPVSP